MSEPSISIAFFDLERGLHGSARSGATLLFDQSASTVLPNGPRVERSEGGWRAELDGAFSLELRPLAGGATLGGVTAHVCQVTGEVGGAKVSCLGTVGETHTPPAWDELDALRSLSAVFDHEHAFLALARRPRGAPGHGQEEVAAWLLHGGNATSVEDARISTVYDGDGHQRSAGLELWLADEDFPRRVSGAVVAGSSLQLEGVDVHSAIFRWRMESREAAGAYELWVRRDPEAA
ncbi:MAG: hypothetical protein H0V50_06310 [Thermoleophilaceae bacterium]|nr:hypothetical protein [Thermoleophilaceae bacterium]